MNRIIIWTVVSAGLGGLAGCAGEDPIGDAGMIDGASDPVLRASFAGKLERYRRGEALRGTATASWDDVAWRGDRRYGQIVAWTGGDADLTGVRFQVSDLVDGADRIPASQIRLRHEGYAKGDPEARGCSGYPERDGFVELTDPLSSRAVSTLAADDPLKTWVTIDVPPSTPPGSYAGTIRVGADGADDVSLTIHLEVVDLVLPDVADWAFHLDLWQYPGAVLDRYNDAHPAAPIAPWSDAHLALLEPAYRILADAGQKTITAHIKERALGGPSMIRWIRGADGSWRYDYAAFDRYVAALRSWGLDRQISAFSIVGWNPDVIPFWDEATAAQLDLSAPIGSAAFAERWQHFLTRFRAHLIEKGWFDQTVLYMDEVEDGKMAQVIDLVRSNSPDWKIGLAYFQSAVSQATRDAMYDLSGLLQLATDPRNPVSTFYTSCTPAIPNSFVTAESDPAEMVWMGWHARREGLDGYLRWAFDLWLNPDPFDIRDERNSAGDFSMLYHVVDGDHPEVLSSIRLELLRDGIQDYERIGVLRASGDAATRARLDAIVDPFTIDSGGDARSLVTGAQQALEDLVTAP